MFRLLPSLVLFFNRIVDESNGRSSLDGVERGQCDDRDSFGFRAPYKSSLFVQFGLNFGIETTNVSNQRWTRSGDDLCAESIGLSRSFSRTSRTSWRNVPNLFFAQRFAVVRATTIAVLRVRRMFRREIWPNTAPSFSTTNGSLLVHVALPTNILVKPVEDRFQLLQRFDDGLSPANLDDSCGDHPTISTTSPSTVRLTVRNFLKRLISSIVSRISCPTKGSNRSMCRFRRS